MISINGKVFSGSNVTIVNGRVINGDGIGKTQKFNKRKSEDCKNFDKIAIDSTFGSVHIFVSNSSKVEAHLYGEANIDGDINFDAHVINRELRITLKSTGNFFGGNLNLDVSVPKKMFKAISAKSLSASFTLDEGVETNSLKVKTQSGYLESNAIAYNISVSTMSGYVELYINATHDINVDVSTMSGYVSAEFHNIRQLNLSTSSVSGNTRNCYKESSGFIADVDISTISGNIRIR